MQKLKFVCEKIYISSINNYRQSQYLTEMILIFGNKTVIPEVNDPRLKLLYFPVCW